MEELRFVTKTDGKVICAFTLNRILIAFMTSIINLMKLFRTTANKVRMKHFLFLDVARLYFAELIFFYFFVTQSNGVFNPIKKS